MKETRTLRGLLNHARSRDFMIYAATGLLLIVAIVLAGADIARHTGAIEAWIANLGPWGVVTFTGLFIVATSLLVPETVLAIMSGAVFGLKQGLVVVAAGALLAAALQYTLSHRLLRTRIQRAVIARPSLVAIQRAVTRDELRLQLLLRLTPLNPAMVSYLLGAAGVRFPGFMLACLALAPHVLIEVYFGYTGKHLARMVGRGDPAVYVHDFIVLGGFALTLVLIVLVSRMARRAVMEAVAESTRNGDSPE